MEVMAQHYMEEAEEPSVLVERRKTRRPDNDNGFHSGQELEKNRISGNSVYLDDNGENYNLKAEDLESLDISKLVNAAINNQSAAGNDDLVEIVVSGLNASKLGQNSWEVENISKSVGTTEETVRIDIVEESDSEEIELEFVRAVEKVHTHTAHCPNCNKEITKVVLRRRIRNPNPNPNANQNLTDSSKPDGDGDDDDHKPLDLFGCLSCVRFFFPSGSIPNLSSFFGPKEKIGSINPNLPADPTSGNKDLIVKPGASPDAGSTTVLKPGINELRTDKHLILPKVTPDPNGIKSVEILKCIVYGGLLESITSLSIVSSAAASDANTLNIIVLGLANVIGGLFVIAKNLVDLKNEDSEGIPNQETHRYKEMLGRRKHFPLHATLAILSFLVFGLIPPIVYGFTFRVSNNKDYKILAVAASSLASIIILATAKTYTKGPEKFTAYIKTILFYCTMAFSVSGVSYAAGDLIKILVQKLGLFEPIPGAGAVASSFISNMNPATPASAYY